MQRYEVGEAVQGGRGLAGLVEAGAWEAALRTWRTAVWAARLRVPDVRGGQKRESGGVDDEGHGEVGAAVEGRAERKALRAIRSVSTLLRAHAQIKKLAKVG